MGRVLWAGRRGRKIKLFAEQDDAVGVGAFGVVIHAPAIGGFGEFLVVDKNEERIKSGSDAAREDGLFQLDRAASADFTDFESDVAARLKDAVQLAKDSGHGLLPDLEIARDGDFDFARVNAEEPTAQPIVAGVLHHIEKRGRGDDQGYGVGTNLWNVVAGLSQKNGLRCGTSEIDAVGTGAVLQELFGLFQDKFGHVTPWRGLVAAFVDFLLRLY